MASIAEVKKQILEKKPSPFYIFTGEEPMVMEVYIEKLAGTVGEKPRRLDAVTDAYHKMQNRSVMTGKQCYVVRDDKAFLTEEKNWDKFISGQAQKGNILILVYTKMDKRAKFYKRLKDHIIEFDKMTPQVLAKYAIKQYGFDERNALMLAEICDCNYGRFMLECNKTSHYADAKNATINDAFRYMYNNHIFYLPPKDAIFDFVDAFCRGEIERSYEEYEHCKGIGESPIVLLSVLYTNFKSMLMVASDPGGQGITERTGLTGFQVKLAKEKLGAYTIDELLRALKLIRFVEKSIKIGNIDQELAIDYLLVNIL